MATPDEPPVIPCHFNIIVSAMNRELTHRAESILPRGLSAAALALFATLAVSTAAQAASFHCPHNASASERIVCTDPTLSALDDKLAALYKTAVDATPDATALEADRVNQWQWRQHNCKDKACVTDWYNRRIAELEGDFKHGQQATAQRVKDGVADQHLAPTARDAVLEMKGIEPAVKHTDAKHEDAEANAEALRLRKMPSGVAADARQKRIADALAKHIPAAVPAPSASNAQENAAAGKAIANATSVASIDKTIAQTKDKPVKQASVPTPEAKATAQTPVQEATVAVK
ncbi:hypothetical protein B0G62_105261 [Paraburkholderia eburnea]|uniref:Lysozyme inhibitor LprI N-terminal domain-containing protein n=2 Tax=Paraburkholderia eburnea TaxID=1189126 RepID=A0A2S4MC22_9BURK|nr:hypothetical protein B0G62_105261 [Paraburkholderia eburnea]PRZ23184.1 hypothetical protein BX588_105261 [Paraburkholderia eburnea]